MNSGIYVIRHNQTGVVYVGSALNIKKRWRDHRRELLRGKHHSIRLQNSWNKYGEQAFEFIVLEPVTQIETLIPREQHWIRFFGSSMPTKGFNILPLAGSRLGSKHHAGAKEKMRAAKLGKKRPPFSDEHRDKIRANKMGNKNTLGQKRSMETKGKIRAAKMGCNNPMWGKPVSDETRRSLSSKLLGHEVTQSTREKIAAGRRLWLADPKHSKRAENGQFLSMGGI